MSEPDPLDISALRTYSVFDRKSLVATPAFAEPTRLPPGAFDLLLRSVPDILAGRSLRTLIEAIRQAREGGHPILWGLGGHVIKVGLTPLIVDLMDRGFVDGIAMNGAAAIHDTELGFCGATSEDVADSLKDGSFGMARETAELVNAAADRAARDSLGFGQGLCAEMKERDARKGPSLSLACLEREIPLTVHVALGQDIVHMHPNANGAAIGEASLRDFRRLASLVTGLSSGVYLNVGSAVALPEVFLKTLSLARNLGHEVEGFTTANLDMLAHYRPRVNVVQRPGGTGLDIRGHHELLIPLLRHGLLDGLED